MTISTGSLEHEVSLEPKAEKRDSAKALSLDALHSHAVGADGRFTFSSLDSKSKFFATIHAFLEFSFLTGMKMEIRPPNLKHLCFVACIY